MTKKASSLPMTKHTRKGAGGKRPNTGPKTNYASMEVKLPPEDKAAVKAKFGRKFNSIFRDWVKTLLK